VNSVNIPWDYIRALLPEIGLLLEAGVILFLDLVLPAEVRRRWFGWLVALGGCIILLLSLAFAQPGDQPQVVWGGVIRLDAVGFVFRILFLTGATLTALFVAQLDRLAMRGEFFALLLVSTLGLSLMASAADMVLLFLAIETATIPLYVMAGFYLRDERSTEAGLKYLLFGAMTSAILLYGLSLLYGAGGTTRLYEIGEVLEKGDLPWAWMVTALVMVLVGFGFKVAAVPFHFWAPDVYEGAPSPVAGFLSTASKAAGFAVLMRFLWVVFPASGDLWALVLGIIATASMLVGNYLALVQQNAKRLLAYSSIAQAGYILIGVAAGTPLGITATTYYLGAYLVTNLAAFAIVALIESVLGSSEISALEGLHQRSPALALAMLAALLSLGGIPPFAGFFAKLLVFGAAVEAGKVWLALVGIFNAIIGLYYYLTLLKVIYRWRPELPCLKTMKGEWRLALVLSVLAILVLGVWFSPWYGWASNVARALWVY
jgi:NADH-quinone oxidoreductase subunit N